MKSFFGSISELVRKGMGRASSRPQAQPRLNAWQEFGEHAARLHASRCVGGLDIANCKFEADGTLLAVFSLGRGRILENALTAKERAGDLEAVKKQLTTLDEWEAFKLGYRLGAPAEAEEVLAHVEPSTSGSGSNGESWEIHFECGKNAFEQRQYGEAERQFLMAVKKVEAFDPDDPRLALILSFWARRICCKKNMPRLKAIPQTIFIHL